MYITSREERDTQSGFERSFHFKMIWYLEYYEHEEIHSNV